MKLKCSREEMWHMLHHEVLLLFCATTNLPTLSKRINYFMAGTVPAVHLSHTPWGLSLDAKHPLNGWIICTAEGPNWAGAPRGNRLPCWCVSTAGAQLECAPSSPHRAGRVICARLTLPLSSGVGHGFIWTPGLGFVAILVINVFFVICFLSLGTLTAPSSWKQSSLLLDSSFYKLLQFLEQCIFKE